MSTTKFKSTQVVKRNYILTQFAAKTHNTIKQVVITILLTGLLSIIGRAQTQTNIYVEDDTTVLLNPERGWFRSIEPTYATDTPAPPISGSLLAAWRSTNQLTLVRKYYLLKQWTNSALPQSVLDEVAADLATCRTQGFKLIPRFQYNFNQSFSSSDATLNITTQHIAQLGPIFMANGDVLDHLHCGFIGKWGEMHTSSQGHVVPNSRTLSTSGQTIVLALLNNTPADRMVGLRYPTFKPRWQWPDPLPLAQAYTETAQARLGGYNQGVLYDNTDYGTYTTDAQDRAEEQAYWYADSDATFMSGEPAGKTSYSNQDPIPLMALIHLASLNMAQYDAINEGLYSYWVNNNYWDNITKRLGYRFVLEKATFPTTAQPGGSFNVNLWLRNEGFAALHNPRDFKAGVRLQGTTNVTMTTISSVDPRQWRPGSSNQFQFSVTVPAGATLGTYEVLASLPDPKTTLSADTRFSIRCANQAIWEEASGTHKLGTITVQSGSNNPPTANNNSYNATEDAQLTVNAPGVLGNDTDPESNPLTAILVSNASHGSVSLNANGSFTYNPVANYNGSDSFTYKANDGSLDSTTATVTLTVASVNDNPIAVSDSTTTTQSLAVVVNVLANDSSPDGGSLTIQSVTQGANGAVVNNGNGTVTYTPSGGFVGNDSFNYTIRDTQNDTDTTTVYVTVAATNNCSLPSPWISVDIGSVGISGEACESAGAYTIDGSGTGLNGTSDQFHFVYQTLSGDGEIKARINSMSGSGSASLAGVMIRDTTSGGANYGMAARRGDATMIWRRRTNFGNNPSTTTSGTMTPPSCWVRLTRTGSTIQAYKSSDGVNWTSMGSKTVNMSTQAMIGLIVTSGNNSQLHNGVLNSVTVVP